MDSSALFFYLLFMAATAWYAQSRGRSPVAWGLVSFLISPLLALIVLAFMKDLKVVQQITELDSRTQNLGKEMHYHKEFNDYRAQYMQQQLTETRQQQTRLQQSSRVQALSQRLPAQPCSQCGFKVSQGQKICPNCGEAGTTPQLQTESFQFSLICPLKTHITHIQNLLMQADSTQQLVKSIEYLDVQTGGTLGGTQKKLTFVVSCWLSPDSASQVQLDSVRRQLSQLVDQAGYQSSD